MEDNTVPINPIEEKDLEITKLKLALEATSKTCLDLNAVKTNLNQTKTELKALKWSAILNKNKVEFARKVVEQTIDICVSDSTLKGEKEEELVALYSTLIDEEKFDLSEDDICSPNSEFLAEAEKHLVERGEKPLEIECLKNFKAKILEAVQKRKLTRRSRADSFGRRDSTASSISLKRSHRDQNGRDSSRAKLESL